MTFERTHDMVLAREVLTHPGIWSWISDDAALPAEQFFPLDHPSYWYVLAFDGEELMGLWLFVARNAICWEVHTCLLPGCRGGRGLQAARELAQWIWEHTPCRRIVTNVPAFNRPARRFAAGAGMKPYGRNLKSYLKFGTQWDEVEYGLSPEEQPCPQP